MRQIFSLFLCLVIAYGATITNAQSQNDTAASDAPKVTIGVNTPPYALKGQSFAVILTQNIIPHWHTYWINFGDSGEEMKLNWTLPEGVNAGAINFPLPKRINYGPLINFGHSGAPQFIINITLPKDYASETLNAKATVKWLVCDEICVPEKQDIAFTIPVFDTAPANDEALTNANGAFTTRLQRLKNNMPQHTSWDGQFYETTNVLDDSAAIGFHITVPQDIFYNINKNADNIAFFPFDYGLTSHAKPSQIMLSQKDGDKAITLILPKGDLTADSFDNYKILLIIDGKGYYIDTKPRRNEETTPPSAIENKTAPTATATVTATPTTTPPTIHATTPEGAPPKEGTADNTTAFTPKKHATPRGAIEKNTAKNEIQNNAIDASHPRFTGMEARIHSLVVKFAPAGSNPIFVTFLFFAFLGGLILNLMPCVFPVLSMKALSVVKLAETSVLRLWGNGIFYTLGVLFSFGAIAFALLLLRKGGSEIGWGFQLQDPNIVIILSWLIFTVGLNLSGIFHISLGRAQGLGAELTTQPGLSGAFFTGMLATLVATPCTAAFMGTALGAAIVLPTIQALAIFLMLGFGLAFPYLLICLIPPLTRLLPRPGKWMETFRQFLAFPMYATSIWLVWVAVRQSGETGLLYSLGGMLTLGFGVWLLRHSRIAHQGRNVLITILALLFLLLPFIGLALNRTHAIPHNAVPVSSQLQSQKQENETAILPFDETKLTSLLETTNNPIFVNMTASWCITCLYNERMTLSSAAVNDWMIDNNVTYMKGDWTNQDEHITRYLSKFGRNGVPLYVFYPAPDDNNIRPQPIILPQILNTSQIIEIKP